MEKNTGEKQEIWSFLLKISGAYVVSFGGADLLSQLGGGGGVVRIPQAYGPDSAHTLGGF